MQKITVFAAMISFVLSMNAFARDPQGETVKYKLNRSRIRTSAVIRKGNFAIAIGPRHTEETKKNLYQTKIDYELDLLIGGKKKGSKNIDVPAKYFDPDFMDQLRREGQSNEGDFKLKYMGKADVETSKGNFPDCDKVMVYDVKMHLTDLASILNASTDEIYAPQLADQDAQNSLDVSDVEVMLYITQRIPAIGAVQIDLSAKVSGFDIKAGLDFVSP